MYDEITWWSGGISYPKGHVVCQLFYAYNSGAELEIVNTFHIWSRTELVTVMLGSHLKNWDDCRDPLRCRVDLKKWLTVLCSSFYTETHSSSPSLKGHYVVLVKEFKLSILKSTILMMYFFF